MRTNIALLLLLLLSFTCNAQEYIIRNYHLDATTKNPYVYDISQDKYGYIWFGTTKGGIYSFNGKDFKYFSQSEGFSNSRVNFIRTDSKNDLWIITNEQELFHYDGKKFHKTLLPSHVAGKNFVDIKGTYWLGLLNGLYKMNRSKFERVIDRSFEEYYWLAKDSKDNLLVLCKKIKKNDSGHEDKNIKIVKLELYTCNGKSLLPIRTLPKLKPISFFVDRDDNIWIGLERKIIKFEGAKGIEIGFNSEFPEDEVTKIVQDKTGDIWFTSKHYVFKIENAKAKCIYGVKDNDAGREFIKTIFADKDNNVWVGSTQSLTKISRNYLSFIDEGKKLSDTQQKESVLFFIDSKNNKWFSKSNEIVAYDAGNRKVFESANPLRKRCTAAIEDASGNLWFDNEKGLLKYDGYKITAFSKEYYDPGSFFYRSRIKYGKDGCLYTLANNSIFRFNGNSFTYYNPKNDNGSFCNLLLNIFERNWYFSLNREKATNEKLISVFDGRNFRDVNLLSRANGRIKEPILEDNSSIWAFINYENDQNELVQIEKRTLKVHRFNQNNGLPAGKVWNHLFDKSGNLWFMMQDKGFFRFNIQEYYRTKSVQFTSFPYLEGSKDETSNPYLDNQGNIWVLSGQGWSKFNPDELKITKYVPDVKLTAIKLFFNSHTIDEFSIGEKNINGIPRTLRLPYDENHLTFEFSAPNYSDPEDVRYSYMLEGVDKQWSPAVNTDKVTYPSLSPGKYIFKIKAFSRDGVSGKEDQFSFEITPPYWNAWWFILIMISAFFGLTYIVVKMVLQIAQKKKLEQLVELRTKQLQEEKEKVELQKSEIQKEKEKVEIKNSELEKNRYQLSKINEFQNKWLEELSASEQKLQEVNQSKDKFFSIISHDLKSPVNSIVRYTDFILEKFDELRPEEIKEYLDNLNNSTRNVYHLVEDLLEWSRIQIGKTEIMKSTYNLSAQVKEMVEIQAGNLLRKKIRLYEKIDDDINIYADENMLRSVLHNLISNAVKFTPENGKVRIEAHKNGGFAEISVIDNGIGISPEDLPKLFSLDVQYTTSGTAGEKGTGLGLILCKELIEKNEGTIYVESILGKGSSFSFSIPLAESLSEVDA